MITQRQINISGVLIAVLFLVGLPVFAQEETTSTDSAGSGVVRRSLPVRTGTQENGTGGFVLPEPSAAMIASMVEKLNVRNQASVNRYNAQLDRAEEILAKIEYNINPYLKLSVIGIDFGPVQSGIAETKTLIVSARSLISAQAGKTYTLSTGATRADLRGLFETFLNDQKSVITNGMVPVLNSLKVTFEALSVLVDSLPTPPATPTP